MIYADHAATTFVSEEARAAALPFFGTDYGNASGVYAFGRAARRAVETARASVAACIGASAEEIVFTGGGSEGNNTVLRGVVEQARTEGRRAHLIVSAMEHSSVLATCRALEACGTAVTYLPVSHDGRVFLDAVVDALREETLLVSVMLANNEIGTVQDIAGLAAQLRGTGIPLHTDAVQAVGHIPVDVHALGVAYLTASAHKFHGMKGTGFLYQKKGAELPPLIAGGAQERGLRAGTENTAGIVALATALAESCALMAEEDARLRMLTAYTVEELRKALPDLRVHGGGGAHLPGILNVGIPHVRGEALVHLLDLRGICVSAASACHAGADAPSHVLRAMGYDDGTAMEALRISYGRGNTMEDAAAIVCEIVRAVEKIRTLCD